MNNIASLIKVFIFSGAAFLLLGSPVYAQNRDVEVHLEALDDYTPPPMFTENTPLVPPSQPRGILTAPENIKKLVPQQTFDNPPVVAVPEIPSPPAVTSVPEPITDKIVVQRMTERVVPPPIPKRRPETFYASQSFVEKARQLAIKAEEHKEKQLSRTQSPQTVTLLPAEKPLLNAPRPSPKQVTEPAYKPVTQNDPLQKELLEPSAQEVLDSIDKTASLSRPKSPVPPYAGPTQITVSFMPGSTDLPPEVREQLPAGLIDRVKAQGSLEIRAFASTPDGGQNDARRISLARALEVRDFLIDQGAPSKSIHIRPLGDNSDNGPADRVDILLQAP